VVKRWKIKPSAEKELAERLAKEINVSSVAANMLIHRGITTYEEAKLFFRPLMEHLHDPFLMKDMDKAIARIEKAIASGEKILIYGDYDVDGTTSVALVYSFLKTIYANLDYYIPDRYKEGYGISSAGIDFASANNFSLIIALDCGIKAMDKITYANSKGVDFIICDHHLPGKTIPDAVAVLDPKRKDCTYPYKELSGCGIGFKLIQAFVQKNNMPVSLLEEYLDLVVVSIAADIVPITGENRILAYYGLKRLNQAPREGIRSMLELSNIKKELTITDIVFVIGPRINAAGRMESGKKAVEFLISSSAAQAIESGNYLNKNNSDRRDLDIYTTQQALQMINESTIMQQRKSTVLFDPNWHKGVIGIVASRLTESYYRPTVMLTQSNGIVSGSARSVKDFDLYEALSACSDLLEQFGGHKFAAGLTLKPENVKAFSEKFEEVVSATITDDMLIPEIEIDATIDFSEITPAFFNIIRQFAPFGPGNMNPIFMTENVSDRGYANIVGSNHLKMDLVHKGKGGKSEGQMFKFPAIAFGFAEHYDFVAKKNFFNVCYHINEQVWEGKTYLQLNVKDIRSHLKNI
jgi:single-stranded-DNA-specific exonuclease